MIARGVGALLGMWRLHGRPGEVACLAWRSARVTAPLAAAVFALAVIFGYLATGGSFRFGPGEFPYHQMLGDSFLAGRLDLGVEPSPALLALSDPYDPVLNYRYRLHDASLYEGRYYVYWGPAPALAHAAWRSISGRELYASAVQVVAAVAAWLFFHLVVARVRRRYFPSVSCYLVWGGSLSFALGGITPYLVARPSVYHESLLAAVAGLLGAVYALSIALESNRPPRRLLVLAALLLAWAVASRITYIAYAFGFGVVLVGGLLRRGRGEQCARVVDLAAFVAPLAVVGVLLAAYNAARFGSPTEFGITYVLQGMIEYYQMTRGSLEQRLQFVDPRIIPAALQIYLFAITPAGLEYPFFEYSTRTRSVVPGHPVDLVIETPIISVFLLAPLVYLALLTPAWFTNRERTCAPIRRLAAGLSIGTGSMLLLLGSFRGVTIRYVSDFLPALLIMSMLLLFGLSAGAFSRWPQSPSRRERVFIQVFPVASWLESVAAGLLLGIGAWQWSFPEKGEALRLATQRLAMLASALAGIG